MAVGKLPWDKTNPVQMAASIRTASFSIPDRVNPQVADMIRSMIVIDPLQRATALQLLSIPLFRSIDVIAPLGHRKSSLPHLCLTSSPQFPRSGMNIGRSDIHRKNASVPRLPTFGALPMLIPSTLVQTI